MTKKAFTKAELLAQAHKDMGDSMPETLLATSDGHLFLVGARNLAADHARRTGAQLFTLKRAELEGQKDVKAATVKPEPVQPEPPATEPKADTPKPKSNPKK